MNRELIKEKMKIALRMRDEIQEIYKKYDVQTVYTKDSVNQCHSQTDENSEGFICEFYYSHPSEIYTPLGAISITTSFMVIDDNAKKAIDEINEKFGFTLRKEAHISSIGIHGGWVNITKLPWDNTEIKPDCKMRDRKDYIDYDEAEDLYNEILNEL